MISFILSKKPLEKTNEEPGWNTPEIPLTNARRIIFMYIQEIHAHILMEILGKSKEEPQKYTFCNLHWTL